MNAPITTLPAPPFLLEVQTERLVDVMLALESAGFQLAGQVGHTARYVLRDTQQQEQTS